MKYIFIKQHDATDCAAACLAMVARRYGLNIPISRIREIAGTDKMGTNAYGIIQAAETLGFTAKGVKGTQEAFLNPFPLPCIAHVVTSEGYLHYVVIHKITPRKVTVADPAVGIVNYSPEEFFELWTGVLILLVPNTTFSKRDEKKGSFSRFFPLLLNQKALLVEIFITSLLITILGIGASFYFRFIMDEVVNNNLRNSLTVISVGVIILYIFKGSLEYFRNHLLLYLSQKLDIPLILNFYQHVLSLPMRFFSSYRIGEIVSRYADAGQIRYAISNAALTIMIDTVMAAVGGAVLYAESSRLFFVATILLVIYATVVFVYNKPIRDSNEEIMEDNAQVTSYLVESLKGIETIKAFNGERHAQYETEKYFVRFLKSVFHNGMISNSQQALTATIAAVGEVVILWMGTIEVLDGKLSIGQLITFNVLLSYFLTPVHNLINLQPIMQTAFVAADRLSEFLILSSEKDDHDNERLKNVSLCLPISISHVDFRFGTRDLVLRDINMKICAGERVALVGESGSGKSTLVKLLMRFFDWEKGEIYFGDYNIKDINLETIRDKIAYISQDVFLFSGTIRQNLCLGNENVPLEDIIQACKLSCAHEFIEKLPKRYDTILEENGANLSGGQKQRLAIARALLKKPDIMIMDEATSNLDLVTEKAIDQTINGLPDTMTTIIIAHRLSTIMNVDKIYVLREGRIIEYGDHQKLISNDGYYAHLWQEQARMNKGDEKQ